MVKEPSPSELKIQLGLPVDATFLGWVIHRPLNDEYVVSYSSNQFMANIGWGLSPQQAKKFKTLKKTISIMDELEISDIAVVAPAFDVGTEIVVFAEASTTKGENANPLRIKS